ncbi:general secretion pathway protein GspB [Kangiella sp. TOML190]|uniref:general secretion pathway protein GspB n=1 Tax=Kangiella sp. TOML190 TaxID=2931351 RepID=UPI0020413965|nr:general secretion pathway protein GspB [Kangiella sp. TOML190]
MSYILDALKKKDTDSDKPVPDLASQHYAAELDEEPAFNKRLLILLICFLLVAVALLSYFLLIKSDLKREISQKVSDEPQDVATKPVAELSADSGSQKKTKDLASPLEPTAEIAIKEEPLVLQKTILKKVEVQSQTPLKTSAKTVISESEDKAPAASTAGVSKPVAESELQHDFSQLPSIKYSAHVYADKAKDRFVMLNGKGLSIGDALPNGIRVEDILENELLVKYKGELYKLPSLTDINR